MTNGNYLLIVTLEAYKNLQKYFGIQNVIPIYIEIDDTTRLERAIFREKQQKAPDYDELNRRFLADNTDFSVQKLRLNNINRRYKNDNLTECFKKIKKDIQEMIG